MALGSAVNMRIRGRHQDQPVDDDRESAVSFASISLWSWCGEEFVDVRIRESVADVRIKG